MSYRLLFHIVLAVFISVLPFTGYAQKDCALTLKEAQKSYEDGLLEKIPAMLGPCIKSGFGKEDKLQALRLIILTNLFEDDALQADEHMEKLLKIEPEYVVNEAVDPIEFINLLNSFQTNPVYTFGITGGLNFSQIRVYESFSTSDVVTSPGVYSNGGVGYQVNVTIGRHLISGLSVNLDIFFSGKKFGYLNSSDAQYYTLALAESQTWMGFPLSLTYDFLQSKKLSPYIQIGAAYSVLLSAKSAVIRTYDDNSSADVTGADVDVKSLRNSGNFWLSGGLGVKYSVKKGMFLLNFTYLRGMQNIVDKAQRYSNEELVYKYYHLDDDFTMDNYMISVGFLYSIYQPKKLKQKKAKSKKAKSK